MANDTAQAIARYHERRHRDWVALLARLVALESPTSDKPAVDRLQDLLAETARAAGARVQRIAQNRYGDLLRVETGPAATGQLLVLCHVDTVWPLGTLARMPVAERAGRLAGPGVFDMKGGVMLSLAALSALADLGLSPAKRVVVLYTTDEEVGSLASRPVIEAEARRSDATLVLEPSLPPQGAVKTSRSGVGRYVVTVTGKPSHSGADPRAGVSAVEELARQTLALHALTDHDRGTTVNVGVVQGGTRPNVVAAEARAEIDVRVRTPEEAARIDAAIRALAPVHPAATLAVAGGMTRPPMARTPAIGALYERARALGAELGLVLPEAHTGGGSDGNFTAALGVPTLDGLGVDGNHAHGWEEHAVIATIPARAALLTRLLLAL